MPKNIKIFDKGKKWLSELQALPIEERKGILFFVVAVVAVILIFFLIQQTKERLGDFSKSLDKSKILPVLEEKNKDLFSGENFGLDEEQVNEMKKLEQKFKENPEEFKELMGKIGENPDDAEKALEEFKKAIEEKKNNEKSLNEDIK